MLFQTGMIPLQAKKHSARRKRPAHAGGLSDTGMLQEGQFGSYLHDLDV